MTDQIPPMPDNEVEDIETKLMHIAVDSPEIFHYIKALAGRSRDLAARLEASNALCAELAEALEVIVAECDALGDVHSCKNSGHLAARSALTRYKEAAR